MIESWFDEKDWQIGPKIFLELWRYSFIMGVLNVTPDSFSDGGDFIDPDTALSRAQIMMTDGATIIDVGGESTRPGAAPITGEEELQRILPVISRLAAETNALISVDTYRADTSEKAVSAGAHIINDVWGCQREPDIANVAADTGAGLVIMNTRRGRDVLPDLLEDAIAFLSRSLEIAKKAGVKDEQIVLDPGFGFAPTIDHDIPILNGLEKLHSLGFPILVGTSRKRFLGALTGRDATNRGVATAATSVVARMKGAALFRVHDIDENKDALAIADALIAQRFGWQVDV